ncbi:MAG: mevalonate kinase [Nitrososphaerota archaeon]|nr:mevalonate kinase [Candidatus Geocrenenecus dongiae]
MKVRSASSPGKIILFGEHFVVYGKPAIVSAIDLRAKVKIQPTSEPQVKLSNGSTHNPAVKAAEYILQELKINLGLIIDIESTIPPSAGLGSSASISVASAAATSLLLLDRIDLDLVREAAFVGEKLVHFNPSGIDTSIALYGGSGLYTRAESLKPINISIDRLLVIDTGKTRKTGEMVKKVREFYEENKEKFKEILEEYDEILNSVLDSFKNRNLEDIGKLMLRNQELLREIGVSCEEIEKAIKTALDAGAYGAKLTGAGGGGCVVALIDEDRLEKAVSMISEKFKVYTPRLSAEGVREEKT